MTIFAILLLFALVPPLASAQDSTSPIADGVQAPSAAQVKIDMPTILDHSLSVVEKDFVGAADAMPENAFNFAPTAGQFKGVRKFAEQIKHVAAVNYQFGSALLQKAPPVTIDSSDGPENLTSKADIMKFLRDSFAYLHRAIRTVTAKNATDIIKIGDSSTPRLSIALETLSHPYDHYGQMVEYLRMNGIVPPASRTSAQH